MANSAEYRIWSAMKRRCTNKNCAEFKNYGGRGITLCPEWYSFESFYKDMGPIPEGMTIDRKDNNLGYSKENCRWATPKEQNRNRRSSLIVNYKGKEMCLAEAAELSGINYATIYRRIQLKWSDTDLFNAPSR